MPVDYSRPSDNAIQYAVRLAHDTTSKLVLATVQYHKTANKVMAFAGEADEFAYRSSRLPEMCDQLRSIWKVPCEYNESVNPENNGSELLGPDVRLLVIGIESSIETTPDKLSSKVDFKMIRETRTPVLLVPDNFQYHRMARMLYAYDYAHEPAPPLEQLRGLTEWLQTDLRFLSVVQKAYSPEEEDKVDKRDVEVLARWKGNRGLSFDYIYYADVSKCLDHYIDLWRADDVIIFSIDHPSFAQRLFHKSVIQEMLLGCNYPIMIIHR